jgi:hypothetical protein
MQEILASTMIRMRDALNEIHIGNFSHSEKAELRPEFMVCDMELLGNGGYLMLWMLIAVLLLAGSSP